MSDALLKILSCVGGLALLVSIGTEADERSSPALWPLTVQEIRDESTLDEQIVEDSQIEHPDHPGQKVRKLVVRFFSHEFKDGPWHGRVTVYIPPGIPDENRGFVIMCPASSLRRTLVPGVDIERDLALGTALLFRIPVATIPQAGEHFGLSRIHQISDKLTEKFLDTSDPGWLAVYPYATLYARAYTLVGKLTVMPTRRVVHMGSSITAHQGWKAASYDPRLAGLVVTGDTGRYDLFQVDGKPYIAVTKRRRPLFQRLADSSMKETWYDHVDKARYAHQIRSKTLQVVGTADPMSAPRVFNPFWEGLPLAKHLSYVPGYPHGCGSMTHVEAFRMWVDHCFFDRPLSVPGQPRSEWRADGRLEVRVPIGGDATIEAVKLHYHLTGDTRFLNFGRPGDFSEGTDHITRVQDWDFVPMRREGREWTASVVLEGEGDRVCFFVSVHDRAGSTPGHAATLMRWLDRSSGP